MKTNFTPLIEEASKQDLFKHKTHENVADAIHNLLISNKGKGQTIGLEGDWGSGKSTVISLLKDKLPKNEFRYFYFDAWAHEGDPLRRVFLESLIDVLGDDKLNDLKERISNRKKTVQTKFTRQVTDLGRWLSLSLFFVPLGAAMVSTVKFNTISLNLEDDINWTLIFGVTFALAPILVVLLNVIQLFLSNKKLRDPQNWAFLVSQGENETTQEISEDEERSSIEFEGYFDEILSLVFEEKKSEQLIMIIDNLDRIDADVSLRIWSTLQTFLKQRNPDSKGQFHAGNIWIIVPYDMDGLSKLWVRGKEDCAQSFFDKCFQLRFEVPRPVFTDWEEFCSQMIQKAFGSNYTDAAKVINILKLTREDLKDIPTPREIKTYVNQLGVVWLSNKDDKPIESLAYYVVQRFIKRQSVKDIQSKLVEGDLSQVVHSPNLPESIIKDIAGLSFGVSSEIGQQLLLEPEIESVLRGNDSNGVLQLVETHQEGFWFVFDHHINTTSNNVFRYASVVKESLVDNYSEKLGTYVKNLRKTNPKFNGNVMYDNHLAYLGFMSQLNFPLYAYWSKLGSYLVEQFNDANFNALPIVDFITESDKIIDDKYKARKEIPSIDADHWFKWFEASHETSWLKWFIPNVKLINEIGNRIPSNSEIPSQVIPTIKGLMKIGNSEWNGILTPIKNHLLYNDGNVVGPSHSIEVVKAIHTLSFSGNPQVDKTLGEILNDARFYNCIYHRRNEGSMLLSAILQVKYGSTNIHDYNIPAVGYSQHGINQLRSFWNTRSEENTEKIYEVLSSNKDVIWSLIQDPRNLLLIDVVKFALENDANLFDVENAFARYTNVLNLIENCDDIDEKDIAKCFVEKSDILKELDQMEDIDVKANSRELSLLLPLVSDSKKISDSVKQLSKEDWDEEFGQNSYLSTLIFGLHKKDNVYLGKAYYDSLLQIQNNWFNKELQPTDWHKDNWAELLIILEEAFLTQMKNQITHLVVEGLNVCSYEFYSKNRDFIDVKKIIANQIREIQILVENLLKDELDSDKLKLVVLLLENQKPKFDKTFGEVVREDLSRHFHTTQNSVKDDLEALAKCLNVKIEPMK
jgi:hypothetical protein